MRPRVIMYKAWMAFLTVLMGSGGQILDGSGLQRLWQEEKGKKSK